jgi:electron transport complex protein RnfB
MIIVYTVLVLGSISFFSGIFLAFSAKKFEVKEDPRIKQVTQLLPGANCGACGYPGCEGFAKEILKGNAKPDSCVPGRKAGVPEKVKAFLSEIAK